MVLVEPAYHAVQPLTLLRDGAVDPSSQSVTHSPHFGTQSISARPAGKQESALTRATTDVGETQEVERLRTAKTTHASISDREAPELDTPGLIRMQ
jgi:hypothetical protein